MNVHQALAEMVDHVQINWMGILALVRKATQESIVKLVTIISG
jgi:hypothetical protein